MRQYRIKAKFGYVRIIEIHNRPGLISCTLTDEVDYISTYETHEEAEDAKDKLVQFAKDLVDWSQKLEVVSIGISY